MHVFYNGVRSLPITDYLLFKGIKPNSKVTNEVYYLSPFRSENRPSLAVNVDKNVWFDFGENVGGSIIDLALRIHNGDRVKANEDLARFASFKGQGHLTNKPVSAESKYPPSKDGIRVINVHDICHPALRQLISSRGIGLEVAAIYCREVWFDSKDGLRCFAIGLPNIENGWELRGLKSFKCSTHPKAISLIKTNTNSSRVSVFEGLFDLLSYAAYCYIKYNAQPSCDLLCLNSLSLLNTSFPILCGYKEIDLYLDNDAPGREATNNLINQLSNVKDKSSLYSCIPNCKDLNQWYILYLQNTL